MSKIIKRGKPPEPTLVQSVAYDLTTEPEAQTDSIAFISKKYDLTPLQVLQLVAHPTFVQYFHELKIQLARHNFDLKAFDRIDSIMNEGSNNEALSAIKLGAELVNYKAAGNTININVGVDEILRKLERDDSKVVEAEVVEEEDYPGF